MILYTNGCSWTWGSGEKANFVSREQRESLLWTHFLGKKLNAELIVNNSQGGGSNPRILRTTYEWCSQQTADTLRKTVAVIQFTDFDRFELYSHDNLSVKYENNPDNWINCKVDCITPAQKYPLKEIMADVNKILSYGTDIHSLYTYIGHVSALTQIFKSFGVNNFYYWNHNSFCHAPESYRQYVYKNNPFLDKHDNNWDYKRVGSVINTDGSIGHDNHPSMPEGHRDIAEIIYSLLPVKSLIKKTR